MLNLREFRGNAYRLADWLPWACLVAHTLKEGDKGGHSSGPKLGEE